MTHPRPSIKEALKGNPWFLFSAFCFFPLLLSAGNWLSGNCHAAYRDILSFRFSRAKQTLMAEKAMHPRDAAPIYLESYMGFLEAFSRDEKPLYEKFWKEQKERIRLLEKSDDKLPACHYFIGSVHLQSAILRTRLGEYAAAAMEYQKAYSGFTENVRRYRNFLPQYAGLGLIHVLAGVVPENYSWALKLFGVEGDIPLGLSEISMVAGYRGDDEFFLDSRLEALFYLSFIDPAIAKDPDQFLRILQLFESRQVLFPEPSNPILTYAKVTLLFRMHRNEDALQQLNLYQSSVPETRFLLLDYLTGVAKLNKLDPSAIIDLNLFLKNYQGSNYLKSACQKIAWSSLISGDTAKYSEYMDLCMARGEAFTEADKLADREARSRQRPGTILLRARLLYDGGYYDGAMNELLNHGLKEIVHAGSDLTEYHYRLGRIYQASGDPDKALSCYDMAIREGSRLPYYYAAASALQSGLICEQQKEISRAEQYFRICLSLDYPEYKTSLDLKARAGLKRTKAR